MLFSCHVLDPNYSVALLGFGVSLDYLLTVTDAWWDCREWLGFPSQQIASRSRRVVVPPGRNIVGGWSECSPARFCCPAVTAAFQTPRVPGHIPGLLVTTTDWLTHDERAGRDRSISWSARWRRLVCSSDRLVLIVSHLYFFLVKNSQKLSGFVNLQVFKKLSCCPALTSTVSGVQLLWDSQTNLKLCQPMNRTH